MEIKISPELMLRTVEKQTLLSTLLSSKQSGNNYGLSIPQRNYRTTQKEVKI
jgi:hypothetical protein